MELARYIHVVRAHRWLVALSILACTAAAAALAWSATPIYAARAQLLVATNLAGTGQAYERGLLAQQRARSYADIITGSRAAQAAIDELGLPESVEDVMDGIRAAVPPDSVLINVEARDRSPEVAKAIANFTGARLPRLAGSLEAPDGNQRSPVEVTVTKPARLSANPVTPRKPVYLGLGALAGLVLGIGGAVLRDALDPRVRSAADARQIAAAPVLATIAGHSGEEAGPVMVDDPHSAAAEGYRGLRANLRALSAEHDLKSFVVSSAVAAEGKTDVAANLGLALAEADARVVIVDANLRSPKLGGLLGMRSGLGLSDVLAGAQPIELVLRRYRSDPLAVLTSGSPRPNPSELLSSDALDTLLIALERWFDFIIIDTPAVLPVADAAALARRVSGVILVAQAASTSASALRASRQALRAAHARVLGVVLGRIREQDRWLSSEDPFAPRRSEPRMPAARAPSGG